MPVTTRKATTTAQKGRASTGRSSIPALKKSKVSKGHDKTVWSPSKGIKFGPAPRKTSKVDSTPRPGILKGSVSADRRRSSSAVAGASKSPTSPPIYGGSTGWPSTRRPVGEELDEIYKILADMAARVQRIASVL
ncbi:hypothetical protein HII31_00850 [Pseudocercospora fuligena]|uniref:Uncharacterized protein n=1 Tax=Pseudocercospora fuligena TaxID=685502 RepID=A0A8H6RST1_9PEZI|nr:hypothetical protein HII31_00850 [Pseudocercospora fuligena]